MGAWLLSDYILVVLAWHGSQVAMVCPLPVPGDLHTLAATSKMWGNNVQQKSWGTLGYLCGPV